MLLFHVSRRAELKMKSLFIAAFLLVGIALVSADLPVHCIRTQVGFHSTCLFMLPSF